METIFFYHNVTEEKMCLYFYTFTLMGHSLGKVLTCSNMPQTYSKLQIVVIRLAFAYYRYRQGYGILYHDELICHTS